MLQFKNRLAWVRFFFFVVHIYVLPLTDKLDVIWLPLRVSLSLLMHCIDSSLHKSIKGNRLVNLKTPFSFFHMSSVPPPFFIDLPANENGGVGGVQNTAASCTTLPGNSNKHYKELQTANKGGGGSYL